METTIRDQVEKVMESYENSDICPNIYEDDVEDLRVMIRQYCKEKGYGR